MGDCPSTINTFHFGSTCSNGMIAQDGMLFHASSSKSSAFITRTEPSAGAPHNAVKVSRVDASMKIGMPAKGPNDEPFQTESRSCVVTLSTKVGKGTTSA